MHIALIVIEKGKGTIGPVDRISIDRIPIGYDHIGRLREQRTSGIAIAVELIGDAEVARSSAVPEVEIRGSQQLFPKRMAPSIGPTSIYQYHNIETPTEFPLATLMPVPGSQNDALSGSED